MSAPRRAALAVVVAAVASSCLLRPLRGGSRASGTCDGACAHYVECKPGAGSQERARCEAECPGVFSDRDSLMAYESLSCQDAVEFVDGSRPSSSAGPARAAR